MAPIRKQAGNVRCNCFPLRTRCSRAEKTTDAQKQR
jgi:hypothetical protein